MKKEHIKKKDNIKQHNPLNTRVILTACLSTGENNRNYHRPLKFTYSITS